MIENFRFLKRQTYLYRKKNLRINNFFSSLLLIPFTLVTISTLLIESIQNHTNSNDSLNHLITGFIGYFLAITISFISLEKVKKFIFPFYFLSLIFLVLVYFFGISIFGAQRWLSLGFISFQPSEVAKLSTVLALAAVLEKKLIITFRDLILPIGVVFLPWVLIFFQPDLGTSLVLITLLFVMLYWAEMPIEWSLIIIFCVITSLLALIYPVLLFPWFPLIGFLTYRSFREKKFFLFLSLILHVCAAKFAPLLWQYVLKDYQKDRLKLFLNPGSDPLGGGYHLLQSKIAIGSGGVFGTGLLKGKLTNLQFIPEQHTDFIFSALGEEAGFLGCCIVCLLFFLLIIRLIKISQNSRTDFESLIVIGITSVFLFQIIINIYMTIGLGPVTGIPLPFMSYGRTSLLINFIFMGLVLSVYKRCRSLKKT